MLASTLHTPRGASRIDADRADVRTLAEIARATGSPVTVRASNGATVIAGPAGFTVRDRHGSRDFSPARAGTVGSMIRCYRAALRESEPENRDDD